VLLSARVHPGETGASWMMEGVLNFLTSNWEEAKILRDKFVFKIIPMLNPDGVIHGNYRCSLAGCDLNRRWKFPSPVIHPSIYYAKKLAMEFSQDREMILFCDLHGHSRKKNLFIYGNMSNPKKDKEIDTPNDEENVKLFPFIMSKICKEFSYKQCKFKVQRHKESTARIAMWRMLPTNNVFTLEASFWGPNIGPIKENHFRSFDYYSIGHNLWQAILIYAKIEWPSLKQYLESKEKEFEKNLANNQDKENIVINTQNDQISKSSNQTQVLKPSWIKFENRQSQNKIIYNPISWDPSQKSVQRNFDRIPHTSMLTGKLSRPYIKI
jgi:cytosolic carboxypeptidase protein 2/3